MCVHEQKELFGEPGEEDSIVFPEGLRMFVNLTPSLLQ